MSDPMKSQAAVATASIAQPIAPTTRACNRSRSLPSVNDSTHANAGNTPMAVQPQRGSRNPHDCDQRQSEPEPKGHCFSQREGTFQRGIGRVRDCRVDEPTDDQQSADHISNSLDSMRSPRLQKDPGERRLDSKGDLCPLLY